MAALNENHKTSEFTMNLYEAHKKLDKINTLIAKGEFKADRDNLWLTWESIYKFANIGRKKKTSHITLLLRTH